MAYDIDLRLTRERLLGNEPASLSWIRDDVAQSLSSSPSPYHGLTMIFMALVDAYVTGLEEEAVPLIATTRAQLLRVAALNRLPSGPGDRALFHENAALLAWFADGRDDLTTVAWALDCHEQYLRSAFLNRGRRPDVVAFDAYMRFAVQACENGRAAQFFAEAAPEDAEQIRAGRIGTAERAIAYALALAAPRAKDAVDPLLRRKVRTWLTGGMRRAAVCWLKTRYAESALSPAQIVRQAVNYL